MGAGTWQTLQSVNDTDSFNEGRIKWNNNFTEVNTRTEDLYVLAFKKNDNIKLNFGTDSDYSLRFDSGNDMMVLNSESAQAAGKLFSVQNNGTEKFSVKHDGVLHLTAASNPTAEAGDFWFSGTDYYLGY